MKRDTGLGVLVLLVLLVPLAALLLSCGGGGGSSSTGGTSSDTTGTGSVAVLLADGPADDYTNIWITIDKIYLLPSQGSPVVIFDGPPVTYDLLKLRDGVALINQKSDVPPGRYEKIRLVVSKIDPVGGECGSSDVKLPSGKIDLNPREPLIVEAGRTVYVHLDFDAEKSINLHKAGKSGKCIFRPVVFVDVKYGEPPRPCPQLFTGTVKSLLYRDSDGQVVDGFILSLCNEPNRLENRGELTVRFLGDVRLFDANGDPLTDPSSLSGRFVTVVGRLSDGKIFASAVAIGGLNIVKGTVADAVDQDFVFPLTPDERSGISGPVLVHLILDVSKQVETLILLGCDKPVDYDRIVAGMTARVAYKLVCDPVCEVRAVAVFLEPPMVSGTIQNKEPVGDTGYDLTILQDDNTTKAVFVPEGTPIHLASGVTVAIELLCPPSQRVSMLLSPDKLPDFVASEIVVELIEGQGRVQSINNQVLTLDDGKKIHVMDAARIVKIENDDRDRIDFEDIKPNDDVVYYGIFACASGSDVDYNVYILLVIKNDYD